MSCNSCPWREKLNYLMFVISKVADIWTLCNYKVYFLQLYRDKKNFKSDIFIIKVSCLKSLSCCFVFICCFFFFLNFLQAATGLPNLLTLLILPFIQRAVRRNPFVVWRIKFPHLKKKQQLSKFKLPGEGPILGKYWIAENQVWHLKMPFKNVSYFILLKYSL